MASAVSFSSTLYADSDLEASWSENFAEVQKEAKENDKHILLNFTGSNWCPPCMLLEKEVFAQPEFANYANESLSLMKVDFPRGIKQSSKLKEQNESLAEKYGIRGFPTVIILDSNGDFVGQTGFQRGGAKAYVNHLKDIIASAK